MLGLAWGMPLREGGTPEDARAVMAELAIRLMAFDGGPAVRAGELEPATRLAGLSVVSRV